MATLWHEPTTEVYCSLNRGMLVTRRGIPSQSACTWWGYYLSLKPRINLQKPHFKVWLTLCDIDTRPNDDAAFYWFAPRRKSPGGSSILRSTLWVPRSHRAPHYQENPQDVNADGGYYVRPLVAASAGGHFRTADLLRRNGADLHVRGYYGKIPLHAAAPVWKFGGGPDISQVRACRHQCLGRGRVDAVIWGIGRSLFQRRFCRSISTRA